MRPTRRQLLKIYGVALPAAIYSLTATRRRMTTNSEECARGSKQEVCGRHKGGRGKYCVRVCVQKACQVVAYKIYARLANVVRLSGEKGLHTHTAHKFLLCGKDGRNSPAHPLPHPPLLQSMRSCLLGALCYEVPNAWRALPSPSNEAKCVREMNWPSARRRRAAAAATASATWRLSAFLPTSLPASPVQRAGECCWKINSFQCLADVWTTDALA